MIAALGLGLAAAAQGRGVEDAGAAQAAKKEPFLEGTGPYSRPVTTTSAEAQKYFDQGLNLLFAFNHDEAARAFRQAAELDPRCAMAWWGLAMAQGPHINRPAVDKDQAKVAWDAIGRAREHAAGASDAERGLIEALAARCVENPPEDRKDLDRAYADAMRRLREAHPEDAEVGAFFAESLMNLRPWDLYDAEGNPREETVEVVATLEKLLAQAPAHPMANHLYIHAVEASTRPGRAEGAADRLRDLQPGLSHNVHMPSHIDVRLGHWAKAEESNRKAIAVDRKFLALRPDPGFYGLYIAHNFHMLAYAAMMRGRAAVAIETIDAMMKLIPEEYARAHAAMVDGYLAMPLEVRMRFGRWHEILDAPEPDPAFPLARTLRHYARAVSLAALGRVAEAKAERSLFEEARSHVAADATFGNNKAVDLLEVAEHLMDGEILYHEGSEDEAFATLRRAIEIEDGLRYSEPPDWIQPVRHALGAALMKSGRYAEAEQVYRADLARLPENGWSLFGLSRALDEQGKRDEAAKVRALWERIWAESDTALSSSCFCLPGT
jgi:tetratricopeptide (TPR) repeat protein